LNGLLFAFGYVIPLIIICVLLGVALAGRSAPLSSTPATTTTIPTATDTDEPAYVRGNADASSAGRRATLLVVVVAAVFAISWLPLQV